MKTSAFEKLTCMLYGKITRGTPRWPSMLVLAAFVLAMFAAVPVQAQTYSETILYAFTAPPDAASPGDLTPDSNGNFYGLSEYGGAFGYGAVFEVDSSGKEFVIHSFTGSGGDGRTSIARLLIDTNNNLFGTTFYGGVGGCSGPGCGTVFELNAQGSENVLYRFTGGSDGANPVPGLIQDSEGNLYGTTLEGGKGYGTVFKVDSSGHEVVFYSFTGLADGGNPRGGLVQDSQGNLYGTTTSYGNGIGYCNDVNHGCGTVFKLDTNGNQTLLHAFTGPDGEDSIATLLLDTAGNLYGTTAWGGTSNLGTVFKIDSAGRYSVLHSFTGADGSYPSVTLVLDPQGNLYGATIAGGPYDCGTVFEIDTTAAEHVLYTFGSGSDSCGPSSKLSLDAQGNIFGTAFLGGVADLGTVFKLTLINANTSTALTSSVNPSAYGQPLTLTAKVTATGGMVPNGEAVIFSVGGQLLGTAPLNNGSASLTISALSAGNNMITATYGGDAKFSGSTSNTLSQAVTGIYSPVNGSTLSGYSATFAWGTYPGATAYWLDIGSAQGAHDYYSSGSLPTSSLSQTVNSLPANGSTVYVAWYYLLNGSWILNPYTYTAYNTAANTAVIQTPPPSSTLSGSSVTFVWSSSAGATGYWLDIGSSSGAHDYFSSGDLGTALTTTANGLPNNGSTIYATLYTLQNGAWLSSAYTYSAFNAFASTGVITSPTPGATLTSSNVTFTWNSGAGASAYWIDIGNVAGGHSYYSSGNLGNATSVSVSGLPTDGSTIFVTLYSLIAGSWSPNSYTYTALNETNGLAVMVSPSNNAVLSGSTVAFDWSAGTGATAYWVDVSSIAPGGNDLDSSGNLGGALSEGVDNLPANGSTVYVTLYSLVGGQWLHNSYSYISGP